MSLLLASCHNSSEPADTSAMDSLNSQPNQDQEKKANLTGCYLRVIKRDTVAMMLEQRGNAISGKLSFDNYEKDGSNGIVKGAVDKGILKLVYEFQSEGINSVMEVYFKITDRGLIQGVGEVATQSDTTSYSNPEKIIYPPDNELLKISCDSLNIKYR